MMYTNVAQKNGYIVDIYRDDFGNRKMRKVKFSPKVFLESDVESIVKGLLGENLKEKSFDSLGDYYNFVREMDSAGAPLHGNVQPSYQYISETYHDLKYNLKFVKTAYIDIEVYSEDGFPNPWIAAWPITSISVKDSVTGHFYCAATKMYDKKKTMHSIPVEKIHFKLCKDDNEILIWLIKLLKMMKPDILCGWYSDGFDFPYIINRFDYIFEDEDVKKLLSPLGIVKCDQISDRDFRNDVAGITLFDYLRLYKKYIFTPRESYKLDFIAEKELGENKIDYSEFDDLNQLWRENPQKYIDYNIWDVELISMLNDKLGLLDLACTVAYKAKCNFIDVLGTIKPWDCIIYNYLKDKNIMIPPASHNEFTPFAGAFVKQPNTGLYDWVVSFDLNSLYPHIQMQWNISPECLVPNLRENVGMEEISQNILTQKIQPNPNYIMAGNGHYFSKEKKGFLPTILEEMYAERAGTKKEMMVFKQQLVDVQTEMKKRGLI